jgi:hypothetical protein
MYLAPPSSPQIYHCKKLWRPASTNSGLLSYIRPLVPSLSPENIEFLERKGALSIPDDKLRNQLLRSYVEYVHPYMPLLEMTDS